LTAIRGLLISSCNQQLPPAIRLNIEVATALRDVEHGSKSLLSQRLKAGYRSSESPYLTSRINFLCYTQMHPDGCQTSVFGQNKNS
jgi:hypothetical protein